MVKTFKDLCVWQKAHVLTVAVYKATKIFPQEEKFGLISQLRRSAASVPANIAEGFRRASKKEYAHFINVAQGSLDETRYHVLLAKDLGYLSMREFDILDQMCDEIGKMLHAFSRSLIP